MNGPVEGGTFLDWYRLRWLSLWHFYSTSRLLITQDLFWYCSWSLTRTRRQWGSGWCTCWPPTFACGSLQPWRRLPRTTASRTTSATVSSLPFVLFLFNACSPQSVHCHLSSSCSVLAHHSQFTATSLPAQCLLTTVSSWPLLLFLLNAFSLVISWPLLFLLNTCSPVSSRPLLFLLNACSPQSYVLLKANFVD